MPQDTVFFDLFEGLAIHVVSRTGHLRMLSSEFPVIQPAPSPCPFDP